jgi:hypothetical protein
MRPEKAKNIINKYFNKYFRTGVLDFPTENMRLALEKMLSIHIKYDYDKRTYEEIFPDGVELSYLEYISDRWQSYHRILAILHSIK